MSCFVIAVYGFLALLLGGNALEPPEPNFDGPPTDYVTWYENVVRGEDGPDKNANELYAPIANALEREEAQKVLVGPRNTKDSKLKPAPWDPKEHSDWEKSVRDVSAWRDKFRTAVARPYLHRPTAWPKELAERDRCALEIQLPGLSTMRMLCRGFSDAAWMKVDGHVDGSAIVTATEVALRAARQCDRMPTLISSLVGAALRKIAFEDIRYALHYDVFSPAQRHSLVGMFDRYAGAPAPIERFMQGEYAMNADFLQRAAHKGHPKPGVPEVSELWNEIQSGKQDARMIHKTLADYRDSAVLAARAPDPQEGIRRIQSDEAAAVQKVGKGAAVLFPSYDRYILIMQRTEADRRGVRLLLELFNYREKQQKWPAALEDLPKEIVEKYGIDPFSNKPFHYALRDGKPLLYSVAQDGDDDGGKHDEEWGDKSKNGDFVFWPVQP